MLNFFHLGLRVRQDARPAATSTVLRPLDGPSNRRCPTDGAQHAQVDADYEGQKYVYVLQKWIRKVGHCGEGPVRS